MLKIGENVLDGKTILVEQNGLVYKVTFPNWQDGTGQAIYYEVSTLEIAYILVVALLPSIPA